MQGRWMNHHLDTKAALNLHHPQLGSVPTNTPQQQSPCLDPGHTTSANSPAGNTTQDHTRCPMKIAGWNINGHPITSEFCDTLRIRTLEERFDAMFLSDTRVSEINKGWATRLLRLTFRDTHMVYLLPSTQIGTGRSSAVGGFILIVRMSKDCGWTVSRLHPDPSKAGTYLAADLHHSTGRRVRAIGVYYHTRPRTP